MKRASVKRPPLCTREEHQTPPCSSPAFGLRARNGAGGRGVSLEEGGRGLRTSLEPVFYVKSRGQKEGGRLGGSGGECPGHQSLRAPVASLCFLKRLS